MEGTHSEKEGKTKKISKAKLREIKKKNRIKFGE